MQPNQTKQLKEAEDMASVLREQLQLSDPDAVELDDVGPGRSGVDLASMEGTIEASAEDVAGIGGGKRDPRITEAAKEGARLMNRSGAEKTATVKKSKLRCVYCVKDLGKAAPFMMIVEGGKKAFCPTCMNIYP